MLISHKNISRELFSEPLAGLKAGASGIMA
jgi:hypothetical protein